MKFNIPQFLSFPMRLRVVTNNIRLLFSFLFLFFLVACGSNSLAKQVPISTSTHTVPRTPVASSNVPPARYRPAIKANVAYGPLPAERLDLCLPRNAPGIHPGILLIHGGGWQSGDKSFFRDMCKSLAAQGFVAATINYRLAPRYTWPAQLVDAQLAVRWLRTHARQTGLDPSRLCAWGESAGAHLAVFLGVLATIHLGDEASLLANQSPAVSCVVDAFGPVDLTVPLGARASPLLLALFGGVTFQDNRLLYWDASPIFDVSPHSSPTMIIQGTQDTLIPPGQSLALQYTLQKRHVFVEYRSYDGAHSYIGLTQQQITAIQLQVIAFLIAQESP
jgi:acetyl esterase/lipase